ncbi:MAG: LamG domain-containing protein [Lentisphaerae bacterium]|nr:LamG domain-containing protein [Lentisphaerota bacterium]
MPVMVISPSEKSMVLPAFGWIKKSTFALKLLYLGVIFYRNRIDFYINNNRESRGNLWCYFSKIDYNKWHHLVFVLDGKAKTENVMRIYLDGKRLKGKPKLSIRQGAASLHFYNTAPRVVQLGALPSENYFFTIPYQ